MGVPVVGPCAGAAQIEGSKSFAKEIMARAEVPTAHHEVFHDLDEARSYIDAHGAPIVVKADGLAAGKGVTVASTKEEAFAAVAECLEGNRFGAAGATVVIEEFLDGVETSFMVLTDGTTALPLPTSMDHKPLLDGDRGPNTGGMGAVSPSPHLSRDEGQRILDDVMRPVIDALSAPGRPYRGFLYAGLMLTASGPKVLEFNCRLGDPETQVLIPRMEDDIVPALLAAATGELDGHTLDISPDPATVVVLANSGYPGRYYKALPISGVGRAEAMPDAVVFHAGTRRDDEGRLVTAGGRVLGVAGRSPEAAYAAAAHIYWPGVTYRTDIGSR